MKRSLRQIAEAVEARLQGDGSVEVGGVASIGSASAHDLVFVEDEKYLLPALQSGAGGVIAGEFAAASSGKPLLISRYPKLTFARAARFLQDGSRNWGNAGVHATGVVHPSARLGPGVVVEERAVIAEDAEIGEGTRIGTGCAVARGVKIGRECEIYPNVTLYAGTTLGDRVIVHAGAVLGSDGFGYVRDPQERTLREVSPGWTAGDRRRRRDRRQYHDRSRSARRNAHRAGNEDRQPGAHRAQLPDRGRMW